MVTISQLHQEQRERFLGTASIRLEALDFSLAHDKKFPGSEPDWANVESLGGLFLNGLGFAPHQISHQIPALIDQAQLSLALANANVSIETLRRTDVEIVELEFTAGSPVRCLRGQDRVLAALSVASDANKRWVIRLYAENLSPEARRDLIDERSLEKEPSDAEHFYWTTRFWLEHDTSLTVSQNKWLAQLSRKSKGKAASVGRLWNNHAPYKNIVREFEKIPALFWGTHLGNIGKWIAMPSEMNLNQTRRIVDFWQRVCDFNDSIKSRLSMKLLEVASGKAPGADVQHRENIRARTNEILGNFEDQERKEILRRLEDSTKDRLVPTFDIFLRNLGYLREVLSCFSHLVGSKVKPVDVRNVLLHNFERQSWYPLQISSNDCRWVEIGGINNFKVADLFDVAFRQLWLFALREFPSISPGPAKSKAGPRYHVEEAKVYLFALLARKLGCRTPQIAAILERPPTKPLTPEVTPVDTTTDASTYSDANLHTPFNAQHRGSKFFFSQRSLYFDNFGDTSEFVDQFLSAAAFSNIAELMDGISQQQEQGDTMRTDIQELAKTKASLEEEIGSLQSSLSSNSQNLQARGAQLAGMNQQILQKQQEIHNLDNDIAIRSQMKSSKMNDLNSLNDAISRKEKDLASITDKTNKEREEAQQTTEAEKAKLHDREDEKNKLKKKIDKLRSLKTTLNDEVTQLDNEKTELQNNIAVLKIDSQTSQSNISELKEAKNGLETEIPALRKEAGELQSNISELKEAKNGLETEIPALRKEAEELNCIYDDKTGGKTDCLTEYKVFIVTIGEFYRLLLMSEKELTAFLGHYTANNYLIKDEKGQIMYYSDCFDILRRQPPKERIIQLHHSVKRDGSGDIKHRPKAKPHRRQDVSDSSSSSQDVPGASSSTQEIPDSSSSTQDIPDSSNKTKRQRGGPERHDGDATE
ncbi:uncharacterized protein FIESC28_00655 [Fusarium coffeatum]|uniref:Uncharacterized protein n=1 Tax=Fusarium coffeatum TaxID=231269 RepID=A0A366SC97_9HYPO|nr:uncharacterized protein FIESC28_00655 [Fusarium coffeatum]RBR26538.1 hypothetical protein FIESC28_00655 [Fusarium coffeatum]